MRVYFRFFAFAGVFVGLIHIYSRGIGPLPPLGPLLSFSQGVFQNAQKNQFVNLELQLDGLKGPVSVIFDKHQVPHIFAQNEHDLYFAQGYITAKFRLWQMDITTRAGGAELSEMMGTRTERIDEFFIHFGLRRAAIESLKLTTQSPEVIQSITSYTQGINAFIDQLAYKDWPVEYKVVQFPPQKFTELRVMQLLKIMSFNLSARSYDLSLTEIVKNLDWKNSVDLFPDYYGDTLKMTKDFDNFIHDPVGKASNLETLNRRAFITGIKSFPETLRQTHTDGSNSWLVSKNATASGHNLLSNDTHLGLKAPPVWFENRLHIENVLDVYGASFPGSPTVILGMNQNFSWGATNGTIDVVDWFEIEFKDDASESYLKDGEWVAAQVHTTELKVRGQKPREVKTLITEFGPLLHREGRLGLSARWTVHEPSNEAKVFYNLNRAQSVSEATEILKEYKSPIQNFSLADREHISIVTSGIFPRRSQGFGRVVEDGRWSRNNWNEFLNTPRSLTSLNPSGHSLHSANQRQAGSDFESYLGWDFEEPYRALRIRTLLEENTKISAEQMMDMQNEAYNQLAASFFSIIDQSQFEFFKSWDFIDDSNSDKTSVFYEWISQIEERLWSPKLKFQSKKFFPKKSRLLIELSRLKNQDPKDLNRLLKNTLSQALEIKKGQNWGTTQPTVFAHVTSFPGFESAKLTPSGSKYSLNSNKGGHGGAWRFIAQMSEPIQAWSQVPGSIEGNPMRPEYKNNLNEWAEGKFKKVNFENKQTVIENSSFIMELSPK